MAVTFRSDGPHVSPNLFQVSRFGTDDFIDLLLYLCILERTGERGGESVDGLDIACGSDIYVYVSQARAVAPKKLRGPGSLGTGERRRSAAGVLKFELQL